jgi:GT2 family glycosyltransferase
MAFDPKREGFEWKQDGYSFCLISGEMFEKYGLFDEQFENYYDDCDFHMRMKKNNVKMEVCQDAIGVHMWGMTTSLGSERHRREELLKSDKQKFKDKWEHQNGL